MKHLIFAASINFLLLMACAPIQQISVALNPIPTPTGTPTETPTPTPTETPTIPSWQATNTAVFAALARVTPLPTASSTPSVNFKYDQTLAPDQRALIEQGIGLGRRYYGDVPRIFVYTSPTSVSLCDNYKGLTARSACPDMESFIAYAVPYGGIFVLTAVDNWRQVPNPLKIHVVIHEYVHLVQYHLAYPAGGGFIGNFGPLWLDEGSADLLAEHVLESERLHDYNTFAFGALIGARKVSAPLSQLETKAGASLAGKGSEYSLGFKAVEYLEKDFGGRQAILKFFASLNRGDTWKGAFVNAFGISANEFYDRFEEYRGGKFPPLP